MLTARVVKLPKAQPAVNNFFPLFAFFFPGALLAARSENLGETRSAVNDFFSPREKKFRPPLRRHGSLCACQGRPAVTFRFRPARVAVMYLCAKKVKRFFQKKRKPVI